MTRRYDWRVRLHEALREFEDSHFVWGSNDCTHFAGRCVEAMTGSNPRATVPIDPYDSEETAFAALKEAGFDGLAGLAAAFFEAVPVAFATDGDIAIVSEGGGGGLGIFELDRIHVLKPRGRGMVPRETAVAAYKVP